MPSRHLHFPESKNARVSHWRHFHELIFLYVREHFVQVKQDNKPVGESDNSQQVLGLNVGDNRGRSLHTVAGDTHVLTSNDHSAVIP